MKLPIVDSARDATTGFPALHRAWVTEALGAPIPRETIATCESCVMLPPATEPGSAEGAPAPDEYFDPATKCCTYTPKLPSFLVGSLLADEDPALADGRARVRDRIAKRIAVTPIGVLPPSQFNLLYRPGSGSFGRTRALRCPYYEEKAGGCTVWKHRNAICTTWWCKHVRGERGERFWKALALLLNEVESALVRHCLLALDVGEGALRALFPHPNDAPPPATLDDLDGRVDEAAYRVVWGNWRDREEAYYRACGEIAAPLRWPDVQRIGGSELALRERMMRDAFAALTSRATPPRAELAPLNVISMKGGVARLVTYSRFDPIDMPTELVPALACFDGGPVDQARARIEAEHGLALDDELVAKLVDFGVLVGSE